MHATDSQKPQVDSAAATPRLCACGKPIAGGIRQVRNGRCDWTVHDWFLCYRVVRGTVIWRKSAT
jgi:hypothetical protein